MTVLVATVCSMHQSHHLHGVHSLRGGIRQVPGARTVQGDILTCSDSHFIRDAQMSAAARPADSKNADLSVSSTTTSASAAAARSISLYLGAPALGRADNRNAISPAV